MKIMMKFIVYAPFTISWPLMLFWFNIKVAPYSKSLKTEWISINGIKIKFNNDTAIILRPIGFGFPNYSNELY